MFRVKTAVARLVRAVTRRLGKGGTTAPGRVLLKLDSGAMGRLGKRLEGGAMLISATNGKTTTAALLNGVLEDAGRPVVRNRAGSNMHWGVTTALLDAGRAPELGDQRQDDDGRAPERRPRGRGAPGRAQPRRVEHALGRDHRAARRRPRARARRPTARRRRPRS